MVEALFPPFRRKRNALPLAIPRKRSTLIPSFCASVVQLQGQADGQYFSLR